MVVLAVCGAVAGDGCESPTAVDPTGLLPVAAASRAANGVIGEWKLDEAGGTSATDTRNGYDAAVFGGAEFVAGRYGHGLNLDNGADGTGLKYAELPSNPALDNVQEGDYAISAWFNPASVPADADIDNRYWSIVVKPGQHMGLFYSSAGQFSARHYLTGNVLEIAQASDSYPAGSWYHVAGVVSRAAGTVKLYVNGVLRATSMFAPNTAAREYDTTRFRIGRARTNWAANGRVDQVRIYDVALSPAQISDLYAETQTSAFRFPVSMSKGTQTNLLGMPDTPDGDMSASTVNSITDLLNRARAAGARVTLRVTGGNESFQTNSDRTFVLSKWKSRFDAVSGMDMSGYLAEGTLIAHYAIDEPFSDFDNMTSTFLEQICQYQKSFAGWREVPCFVREINTRLYDQRPPGGAYRYIDAGWAQLADHQYVPASKYAGDIGAYFRDNLAKGRRAGLGLMYGFNLLEGGRETPGCARPDGPADHNCAMSAAEIRELADTLAALGDGQGCGVNGWRIASEPGAERDYFFSVGSYANNGVRSAVQYLNKKVGGLRPGPCGST